MAKTRTRYAPSPTGYLHVGGARTALFAFLHAKSQGGDFLIRLEDTDLTRNLEDGEDNQIDGLEWLGIKADFSPRNSDKSGPFRQSERINIYNEYIQKLIDKGHAYECWCTSEELKISREKQIADGHPSPVYDGKCLTNPEPKEGMQPAIRLKVPNNEKHTWNDGVRGMITVPSSAIGDWVIKKSNGIPTYNFANVIDDHLMNITDVHRGEEHISNTPKQLYLYKLFDWEAPKFYHLTIIIGENGKKLSKRDEKVIQFVHLYKERGYLPEAIFNFLSLLGWSPKGEEEIFSQEELINIFDPTRLSKSPTKFDIRKLQWTNNQYIQKLNKVEVFNFLKPFIVKTNFSDSQLEKIFNIFQPGLLEGIQIQKEIKIFEEQTVLIPKDLESFVNEGKEVLNVFKEKLSLLEDWNKDSIKKIMINTGEELEIKGAKLMKPIRVSLTGKSSGPDISSIIEIFGKEKTIERLSNE